MTPCVRSSSGDWSGPVIAVEFLVLIVVCHLRTPNILFTG